MTFKDPAYVVNRSLDALGTPYVLGSLEDGTTESEPARRAYGPMLRQLLRAAHWNFSRAVDKLELLADASGQTLSPMPPNTPISMAVEQPWLYAYAWPPDGVAARWLPWRMEPLPSSTPLYTNQQSATGLLLNAHPARFLISSSNQFPVVTGEVGWADLPDLDDIEGVGPIGRRVVLTNVPFAHLVYTRLVLSIEEWDPLFEETMVAYMAQRLALVAIKDRKEAIAVRNAQISIVKDMLMEARARNANDAGFPQTPDHVPDWIRARRYGGSRWGAGGLGIGAGVLGYGWDSLSLSDGSVF